VSLHVIIWLYIGSTLTQFDFDSKDKKHGSSTIERIILVVQIFIAFAIGIYISMVAKKSLNSRL
jgi:hypothetical protein